ncbi:hypothetical protein [Fervidibacter sacchari]
MKACEFGVVVCALGLFTLLCKRPSTARGDATKFVINHWLKPVAWLVANASEVDASKGERTWCGTVSVRHFWSLSP